MPEISPETVLLFAFVKAHCLALKRRERDAFLKDAFTILELWADMPVSIKEPHVKAARDEAMRLFRVELPKLLA